MISKFYWLLLLLPMATSALAQPAPHVEPGRLRAILETESGVAGTQAVEFGMWVDDREVLTLALGKSMETVPAGTDMHFRIGGISEMFLATLTMRLVEEGLLRLEDPLARWFPDLPSADQVNLGMLLANTGGYPDYVRQEAFIEAATRQPYRSWRVEELLAFALGPGKMNFSPGTSQAYSHTEYLLLGEVLARQTGLSMAELYRRYVLEPAGLEHTELPLDQEIRPPYCTRSAATGESTKMQPTTIRPGPTIMAA